MFKFKNKYKYNQDSPYVVCSMRIMTRMGMKVLANMNEESDFVKCLHSVGVPLPTNKSVINSWPCNPELTMVAHFPDNNEVASFGSGYGGNSLLVRKIIWVSIKRISSIQSNCFSRAKNASHLD